MMIVLIVWPFASVVTLALWNLAKYLCRWLAVDLTATWG